MATHVPALFFRHCSGREHAALPADRIFFGKDARLLPARRARYAAGTRFDTRATNGARLRKDDRQRCVVQRAGFAYEAHAHLTGFPSKIKTAFQPVLNKLKGCDYVTTDRVSSIRRPG